MNTSAMGYGDISRARPEGLPRKPPIDQDVNASEQRALLLQRCGNGDAAALRTLYDDVAPKLFAVILRILPRRDLAEEALQEVFLSVWRNAATYRAVRGSPMAWLASIARNRALDMRRSLTAEPLTSEPVTAFEETIAGEGNDPEQETGLAVEARRLDNCMRRLTAEQNQALRLAFTYGLSYPEIAQHIHSPLGTVKSWVRRGLQALKTCLE
jgi:RNA polymerase sigma-70 factor, ECF subfamily